MRKATPTPTVDDPPFPASEPVQASAAEPRTVATDRPASGRPKPSPALAALLKKAAAAAPDRRIELRDPIAAHGARAIDGVRPWLADPRLAAFAIRVIERAGCDGEPELASQVLRSGRSHLPPGMAGDADWALQHLRTVMRPEPPPRTPASAKSPPVRADLRSRRRSG